MSDSHERGTASVSRRRFLQAVGVAGIAAAGGPVILHATNKSGIKRPVVGDGAHTFEVYHDWGELPASIQYGNTHGVCEDAQGHIYIHHTVNATSDRRDSMVVFDRAGREVAVYRKIHLFDITLPDGTVYAESASVVPGRSPS